MKLKINRIFDKNIKFLKISKTRFFETVKNVYLFILVSTFLSTINLIIYFNLIQFFETEMCFFIHFLFINCFFSLPTSCSTHIATTTNWRVSGTIWSETYVFKTTFGEIRCFSVVSTDFSSLFHWIFSIFAAMSSGMQMAPAIAQTNQYQSYQRPPPPQQQQQGYGEYHAAAGQGGEPMISRFIWNF